MPVTRMIARLALAGAATFTLAVVGVSAAYGVNTSVSLQISGLPSGMTAGTAAGFSVDVRNDSGTQYGAVQRVFVVQLPGLTAGEISISRAGTSLTASNSGSGQVTLVDPTPVAVQKKGKPGATQSWPYTISFTTGAPAGSTQITFTAYSGASVINSTSTSMNVVSAGGPTPTPTPTSAPPTTPAPTTPGASASASPQATSPAPSATAQLTGDPSAGASPGDGNGVSPAPLTPDATPPRRGSGFAVPSIAYVIGAALLASGGAILWFLVRRPARDDQDHRAAGAPAWGLDAALSGAGAPDRYGRHAHQSPPGGGPYAMPVPTRPAAPPVAQTAVIPPMYGQTAVLPGPVGQTAVHPGPMGQTAVRPGPIGPGAVPAGPMGQTAVIPTVPAQTAAYPVVPPAAAVPPPAAPPVPVPPTTPQAVPGASALGAAVPGVRRPPNLTGAPTTAPDDPPTQVVPTVSPTLQYAPPPADPAPTVGDTPES
jgi:hypothetical protein